MRDECGFEEAVAVGEQSRHGRKNVSRHGSARHFVVLEISKFVSIVDHACAFLGEELLENRVEPSGDCVPEKTGQLCEANIGPCG